MSQFQNWKKVLKIFFKHLKYNFQFNYNTGRSEELLEKRKLFLNIEYMHSEGERYQVEWFKCFWSQLSDSTLSALENNL